MRTATGSGGGAAAETGGDGGSVQQGREAEVREKGKRGTPVHRGSDGEEEAEGGGRGGEAG